MFSIKKHLLPILLCLLFTILQVDCMHARQEKGKEQTSGTEKSTPSLTIKESSVQIAPVATPAGQSETQKSDKNKAAGGNQPHITIDAPDYDAGEVWENEDIVHAFIVRNTGTAQLDITNVKAG
jgi:hypothetical protein